MEIGVLTSTAIAILIPFFKSLLDGMAKKAGEEIGAKTGTFLWEKARTLHEVIKAKFSTSPKAQEALMSLEKAPESNLAQEKVRQALQDIFQNDDDFVKEVTLILNETTINNVENTFQTNIKGDVGKVINVVNPRDIHIE